MVCSTNLCLLLCSKLVDFSISISFRTSSVCAMIVCFAEISKFLSIRNQAWNGFVVLPMNMHWNFKFNKNLLYFLLAANILQRWREKLIKRQTSKFDKLLENGKAKCKQMINTKCTKQSYTIKMKAKNSNFLFCCWFVYIEYCSFMQTNSFFFQNFILATE